MTANAEMGDEEREIVSSELIDLIGQSGSESSRLALADATIHSLFRGKRGWEPGGSVRQPSGWALEKLEEVMARNPPGPARLHVESIRNFITENISSALSGFLRLRPFVLAETPGLHTNLVGVSTVNSNIFSVDEASDGSARRLGNALEIRFEREPRPSDGRPMLVTCADRIYCKRFLPEFVRSLHATGNRCHLHLHVIHVGGVETAWHASLVSQLPPEDFSISHSLIPPEVTDTKAYFALTRLLVAPQLMARYERPALITDIDSVFTQNLDTTLAELEEYDVGLNANPAYPRFYPWRSIAAGEIYVAWNRRSQRFFSLLRDYAIAHFSTGAGSNWWIDQNALLWAAKHCRAFMPEIRQVNLRALRSRTRIEMAARE